MHDCCQILGSHKDEKMIQISKAAVDLGKGDLSKTIKTKRNLLESIGAEVEAHRRKIPGPSQTTRNIGGFATGLDEALRRSFVMGIKIAKLGVLKSLED